MKIRVKNVQAEAYNGGGTVYRGTVFRIGFYTDISWETRCSSEIKIWGHLFKILEVFEVPAQPQVKGMSGSI